MVSHEWPADEWPGLWFASHERFLHGRVEGGRETNLMGRMPTIIKAGTPVPAARSGPRPMELTDVLMEARSVLDRARREAERMLVEARREAERLRDAARTEGREAGYAEGLGSGREAGRAEAFEAATRVFEEQHAAVVEACRECIAAIDGRREAWERSSREDLVELAMAIARRVAHHVGERERNVVLANLEMAARLVGTRSEVTVAVSPGDAETARTFGQGITDADGPWKHVRVIEDAGIRPGGCRIQWESGAVDATLETQLDRIEEELRAAGALGSADHDGAEPAR